MHPPLSQKNQYTKLKVHLHGFFWMNAFSQGQKPESFWQGERKVSTNTYKNTIPFIIPSGRKVQHEIKCNMRLSSIYYGELTSFLNNQLPRKSNCSWSHFIMDPSESENHFLSKPFDMISCKSLKLKGWGLRPR